MATEWTHIRVPKELRARLHLIAARREWARQAGLLETGYTDTEPDHAVIAALVKMWEDRARRRSPGKKVSPEER